VIDFSSSAAFIRLAELALVSIDPIPAFVVGSTGWKPDELKQIEMLAAKTPVLLSSNFSTGVFALQKILKEASPLLSKLGYSPVLVEAHHQHKKDAPSGTALTLARAIGPNVPTHSIRAGEVIGDHEVTFYGPGDKLVFAHFAQDRSIFARGALDAAIWIRSKRSSHPGKILTMENFFSEL
jgi:4-hydroxy-tetrahydrodipicolinate reductase